MINILKLVLAIIGFSLLAEVSFGQGDAPAILRGLNQADKSIGSFIRTPNGQATKISSSSALIETGNNNILENPNFEHSVYDTSWVIGSGSSSKVDVNIDNTKVFSGLNALKMTMAASTLGVFNVSPTGNQAYKDGVQGLVSVRIKTTVSGIRVCQRKGFAITTNCVNVNPDGKWNLYKVPSILGEFYNGVEITSSPAVVTGDVYIDDAFVGAVDLKQDVNNIGPWTSYTPTVSHDTGGMTNSTVTAKWRQVGEQIEVSGLIRFSALSAAFAGMYVLIPAGYTIDTAKLPGSPGGLDISLGEGSVYDFGSNLFPIKAYYSSTTGINLRLFSSSSGSNPVLINSATVVTNTNPITFNSADSISFNFTAPITQFSGSTSVYSTPNITNADRIGEIVQTTNAVAPNGFISAMNKSIGQTGSGATFTGNSYYALYEHIWGLAGLTTTAGDVYRISSAKGASASADFAANKTITIDYETNAPFIRGKAAASGIGSYSADTFQGHWHSLQRSSTLSGTNSDTGQVIPANPNLGGTLSAIKDPITDGVNGAPRFGTETKPKNVSLFMYIRYTGDSNIIIGSFNGLQTCTDTLACTDTFSAYISAAGIVSQENTEWLTGNCSLTGTSQFDCAIKTGLTTTAMNCNATTAPTAVYGQNVHVAALTASTLTTVTANNATPTRYGHYVICQKAGADYIGKTAMAVASDQNVRSIGSTNVDIQSVYFAQSTACSSTPCAIASQVGSKITSVSFEVTGVYRINGIDGLKYICNGSTSPASPILNHDRANSTTSYARILTRTTGSVLTNAADVSITCIGIP